MRRDGKGGRSLTGSPRVRTADGLRMSPRLGGKKSGTPNSLRRGAKPKTRNYDRVVETAESHLEGAPRPPPPPDLAPPSDLARPRLPSHALAPPSSTRQSTTT